MGWFTEQIEQRKKYDKEAFEDSLIRLAGSVIGDEAAKLSGKDPDIRDALKAIVRYFGIKYRDIPLNITDIEGKLDYVFHPEGIMYRRIKLEKGWYKEAYGAMLAWRSDNNEPVALLPDNNEYYFYDEKQNKKIKLNSRNENAVSEDAILFYASFPLRKMDKTDLLKFMISRLDKNDIAVLIFSSLAVTLVGMLIPALNKRLFSTVVDSGKHTVLAAMAVFMICVELSMILFEIVKEIITSAIHTKICLSVEAATMMRLLSMPAAFFRKYSSGELANRAGQLSAYCETLVHSIFSLGLTSIFSLVYIGQIFVYAPGLVAAAIYITLITVLVFVITSLWQMRMSRKRMLYTAKESGIVHALFWGIQKIRLAGAEKRAFAKWADEYSKEAKIAYDPPLFLKLNTMINMAVSLTGAIVIYYLAVKTKLGTAEYYAFNASYAMVQGAFTALAGAALITAEARPMLDMCMPLLETEPEATENKQPITRLSGSIELNNVTFAYSEDMPKVTDNLSLKIKSGQYVAIVGKTGCGKSTLMRLLLGFEKPQKGAIFYDGLDLQRIDLHTLRKKIGVVMQDGKLFSGDIFSNIALSAPDITDDEAWEAAETAGIAEDIRQMPMGMHTFISEGSGGISGGQKQRLMIARAIASKPKILMLDEATSALDNITQKKISDALEKLKCTRIVIAHRLSTIINCDRIILLDKGKIAEDGTYAELMEKGGIFAELVKRQMISEKIK